MRFINLYFVLSVLALSVHAQPTETNAQRMARGLPPLAPAIMRRGTRVEAARRHAPSGSPNGQCNTGSVQCCNSVQSYDSHQAEILGLLGIIGVPVGIPVGMGCSSLNVLGVGGNSCSQQTVCCENNHSNSGISIGCTPINIG